MGVLGISGIYPKDWYACSHILRLATCELLISSHGRIATGRMKSYTSSVTKAAQSPVGNFSLLGTSESCSFNAHPQSYAWLALFCSTTRNGGRNPTADFIMQPTLLVTKPIQRVGDLWVLWCNQCMVLQTRTNLEQHSVGT